MRKFLKGLAITVFFGFVGGFGVALLLDADNNVRMFLAGVLSVFVFAGWISTMRNNK